MTATVGVGLIASAPLPPLLTQKAPGGFHEKGVDFDKKIMQIMKEPDGKKVLDIDDLWVEDAEACGAKVISMLAGILHNVRHTKEVLSYEAPFGVGYLVTEMKNH